MTKNSKKRKSERTANLNYAKLDPNVIGNSGVDPRVLVGQLDSRGSSTGAIHDQYSGSPTAFRGISKKQRSPESIYG